VIAAARDGYIRTNESRKVAREARVAEANTRASKQTTLKMVYTVGLFFKIFVVACTYEHGTESVPTTKANKMQQLQTHQKEQANDKVQRNKIRSIIIDTMAVVCSRQTKTSRASWRRIRLVIRKRRIEGTVHTERRRNKYKHINTTYDTVGQTDGNAYAARDNEVRTNGV